MKKIIIKYMPDSIIKKLRPFYRKYPELPERLMYRRILFEELIDKIGPDFLRGKKLFH